MFQTARLPTETGSRRLGALARLPVFYDLHNQRAVVAGGSAAAAWKAELLAAAGAQVDVYAPSMAPEMTAVVASGAADGALNVHRRCWTADDLAGAIMAVADAEDDAAAADFATAARRAGVPVNVIDRPAFCDFQFGGVVNRSPVVIGISTDGAAPILGQAIRRRIETLLHPSLSAWAALARDVRSQVLARLPPGLSRRALWERFADMAFSGRPPAPANDSAALADIVDELARREQGVGKVTLVGAGPGDAELLTLKAMRALQAADVILFDDLVSQDVLELARREARRMLVGKRGGQASCAQQDINDLMTRLASQGKHVVRLKSGDPMIFGRAGEEIAHLEAAGVAVDIVPGVTAGIAMAASLGVSLTQRNIANAVRLVTGCASTGRLPDNLDWRALCDPATTTVFYMGGAMAGQIAARLIAEGRCADTPAVMVSGVSGDETRWIGPISALGQAACDRDASKPVLIGVGEVFARARAGARGVAPAPVAACQPSVAVM